MLRRLDEVPWWSYGLALHLFSRERRALERGARPQCRPKTAVGRPAARWCAASSTAWRCIWPSRMAMLAYFRSAKQALRRLHRAGICHNDLAKEQNWLGGRDGRAYLTDFQLAACFKRRSRLFRVAAYEDLRHMLKHKRSYAPEALTPKERKILARKSLVARVWLKTGKKVYQAITRGLFNFTDREGGGKRLVNDAPVLARDDPQESRRARHGDRRLRRPPHRRRALCLRRGGSGRRWKSSCATTLARPGRKAAGAYPGGPRAAARRRGQAAHRDPAARRDEPARSDRADDARASATAPSCAKSWRAARICATGSILRRDLPSALTARTRRRETPATRDARHSVHSMPRRGGIRRKAKGSLSARDIRFRSRRTSASGRKAGRASGGTVGSSCERRLQMRPRLAEQSDRSPRAPAASACPQTLLRCRCRAAAAWQRHEQLPPRAHARGKARSPAIRP